MAQYRRGTDAVAAAATSGGGGNFSPFVPDIRWKEDGEKKFVLVLTPADGIAVLDLHEFIPIPTDRDDGKPRYESFLSRKDPMIGENYDLIEDEHGRKAKTRCAGVAVELVPVMKDVKGRKRPGSFTVKTETFKRRGDDGEEEVEKPCIGLIVQSSKLMWGPLNGLDESAGPLVELPIEITKRGEKAETTYEMVPFMDIPVDLSLVTEYIDGISYLKDDIEDLLPKMEAAEDDTAGAQLAADFLLEKRVDELADEERYERLVGDLEEIEPNPWEKGKKKAKASGTRTRKARPSQRKGRTETVDEAADEADSSVEAESTEEEVSEEAPSKSSRFEKLKARAESK